MKRTSGILLVLLMGSVFLALTLIPLIKSVNLKKHGVSTESTVVSFKRITSTKGHTRYDVTVSFNTSDGKVVTAKATKRQSVSVGEKLIIYYNPVSPQKIDFCDSIGYNLMGAIVGGFIFLLGLFLLIRQIINDSTEDKLVKSGKKISAEFVSIERNEKYRMGDKNPWVIKCKWIDNTNNMEYKFISKSFIIDPAPYLNGRYHIDVFIDPANPGKYFMDTSFMPQGDNTLD